MGANRYEELPLGEIADFRNGKGLSPDKYTAVGKYPVFGSNGQIARTDELLNEDPVVVIGRVGAYCGSVHPVFEPSWVTDNAIVARPKAGDDVRYLYYRLASLDLRSTATGSAQPLVTQGGLGVLRAPHAPPEEQRAIAQILGTLDDKIELNRRMNETLEAMARALFKSWFVDFDPVRAKAQGQTPPGMDPATAALFPSEFQDSELGEIPKGWRAGHIGEVIEIHDSKRIPLSKREREQRRGVFPYYGATSVMDYVDDYLFNGTYVLIGEDGSVVTDSGYPFMQYVWGKFWVNNHAHVLTGVEGVSQEHLYLLLSKTNISAFVTGAVQAKLSQGNLKRVPCVIAPSEVNRSFATCIADLFARFRANTAESVTLVKLRDALLPRLLSGELSVAQAEQAVETTA